MGVGLLAASTFSRKCPTFYPLVLRYNKKLICGVNLTCLFGPPAVK